MQLNKKHTLLVGLVRSGLSKGPSEPPAFPVSEDEWIDVLNLAVRQRCLPLAMKGYSGMTWNEDNAMSASVMEMANNALAKWFARYNRVMHVLRSLSEFFFRNGIDMMVVKGYALSLCYPDPSDRVFGDVDMYLFGKWKEGDALIEKEFGIDVNASHHHHTVFHKDGILVENFYDFLNVHSQPSTASLEPELKKMAMEEHEIVQLGGHRLHLPSPNLAALFYLRHTAQHFASSNMKIRDLVDWYLFKRKYGAKVEWNRIENLAEASGMRPFLRCYNEVSEYLVEGGEMDALSARVLSEILEPAFSEKIEEGKISSFFARYRRWRTNRWKNEMVYKEGPAAQLIALLRSHLVPAE